MEHWKTIFTAVAEDAARAASTFYPCIKCNSKEYTENRLCYACKWIGNPQYSCGYCLLGCYGCSKIRISKQ